jgi:hypothetical protein
MFDITTPVEFYQMLVEDFDEYMAEPHSTRRALHCAIVAYHLHEWVWGGWLKGDVRARSALGVDSRNSFLKWIDEHCIWFGFVQDLANGTKHFRPAIGFETVRVVAAPFAFAQPTAGFDQGARAGHVRYVSGEIPVGPGGNGYLMLDLGDRTYKDFPDDMTWFSGVDDGEHDIEPAAELRFLPAAHLLEAVVRFWRDFFRTYLPSPNLPASKHHIT